MYQVILCTCPNMDLAKKIATTLVTNKLAACVNIISNIVSIYNWNDKLVSDDEVQLLIKTQSCLFSAVESEIIALHPYDTPEIIAIDIQQGNKHYLNWIKGSLKS